LLSFVCFLLFAFFYSPSHSRQSESLNAGTTRVADGLRGSEWMERLRTKARELGAPLVARDASAWWTSAGLRIAIEGALGAIALREPTLAETPATPEEIAALETIAPGECSFMYRYILRESCSTVSTLTRSP
jgi:hypothetical protein